MDFTDDDFSIYFPNTNSIRDNNKKFEDIKSQIFQLKIFLNEIYQFYCYLKNNNLFENQFQQYYENCKKYLDNQNVIINEMLILKDSIFDSLKEWKSTQTYSIIDDSYDKNISQIQEWLTLLFTSINNVKELSIQYREYILMINNDLIVRADETNINLDYMMTEIINVSLVIEEQPKSAFHPLIIITRSKFAAKVRLLIANKNIADSMLFQPNVEIRLLNAQEVNCLYEEGIDSLIAKSRSYYEINNGSQSLKYDSVKNEFTATFSDINFDFKPKRVVTCPVAEEKFTFMFITTINIANKRYTIYALSLPVVIISKNNSDALATILWDTGLSNQERRLLTLNDETQLLWSELAKILNCKFKHETGSAENLRFIRSLIPSRYQFQSNDYNNEMISWKQFWKIKLPDRSFTFWEWFKSIMDLTREHLNEFWNKGFIIGFISSEDSYKLLSASNDGTFLLRFSESLKGCISINFIQNGKFMKLSPYNSEELTSTSLPNRIRGIKAIDYLHPGIPKNEAFGSYYTTVLTKKSITPHPYDKEIPKLQMKMQGMQIQTSRPNEPIIAERVLTEEDISTFLDYFQNS